MSGMEQVLLAMSLAETTTPSLVCDELYFQRTQPRSNPISSDSICSHECHIADMVPVESPLGIVLSSQRDPAD